MIRVCLLALPLLVLSAVACHSDTGGTQDARDAITIEIQDGATHASVKVELAVTLEERAQGLMFRKSLPEDRGMLFLYPEDTRGGHWMRNTEIPLDIAYADAAGTVFQVSRGIPLDETVLRASQSFRYVLEVRSGWFERHGLGPGARLDLPPGLPAAR